MSNIQHKTQADGRWHKLPFLEQMANIGSEVVRAINWKKKNNMEYADAAFYRSLELMSLSLDGPLSPTQMKELCRAKETFIDFYKYNNIYNSTDESWIKYFTQFTYAAQMTRLKKPN